MEYTVTQALEILKRNGVTESEQMVRKWLRSGELVGRDPGANRKAGWVIAEHDLQDFIKRKNELQYLRDENERLRAELEALSQRPVATEQELVSNEVEQLRAECHELRREWLAVANSSLTDRYRRSDVIYKTAFARITNKDDDVRDRRVALYAFVTVIETEMSITKSPDKLSALKDILDEAHNYIGIIDKVLLESYGNKEGRRED